MDFAVDFNVGGVVVVVVTPPFVCVIFITPIIFIITCIIDDVIVAGRSKPCLVLEPLRNLNLFALRPSFPFALDGGDCQRQSEVMI